MNASIDAVILGGGTLKGLEVSSGAGAADRRSKALLEIGGREMIEYIIDALRATPRIGKVIAVAPEMAKSEAWAERVDSVLPAGDTIIKNVAAAIKFLQDENRPPGSRVLFLTCDIPLLSSEAINDFLERADSIEGDVFYPIMSQTTMEAAFPETQRTYGRLKDGIFTGGNIALMIPEVVMGNLDLIENAFEARKSVPKLMRILGPRFIAKFATRTLTVPDIEKRMQHMTGARTRAVETPFAVIGVDVDKPADIILVEKELAAAKAKGPSVS